MEIRKKRSTMGKSRSSRKSSSSSWASFEKLPRRSGERSSFVADRSVQFQKMAILGVGLIGGSLAMVCKQKGLAKLIVGYGRRPENLKKAVKLGVIDRFFQDHRETVQ